mmetsp:Transcript_28308/g.42275  ORF Transcript_28308/g.42275 Transcript_28308/m.42275 type:complete len:409 (-) Transcript_28308:523-1749(-)
MLSTTHHHYTNQNNVMPTKVRRELLSFLLLICLLLSSSSNGFIVPSRCCRNNGRITAASNMLILTERLNRFNGKRSSMVDRWRMILQSTNSNGSDDAEEETDANTSSSSFNSNKKKSIAIVGSGAVGCYYGARLWECKDYDVHFFMRGEHYDTCKTDGLEVKSVYGDIIIPPEQLNIHSSTEEMGQVDWVILALKSTALDAAPSLLLPLLKPSTRIIAIMNGLFEDELVKMLDLEYQKISGSSTTSNHDDGGGDDDGTTLTCCSAIYGGMALLCSNRIAPGKIDHSYAGKLTVGIAASSSPKAEVEERHKRAIVNLWSPVTDKVEFVYTPSITRGRWTKNVWNLPFNGVSVAMGGITIEEIVQDEGLRRLADIVMDETISVANADLKARGEDIFGYLGDAEVRHMTWE